MEGGRREVDKERRREEAGRRRGSDPGYRIKNKNPTQSCGEKYMGLSENRVPQPSFPLLNPHGYTPF